MISNAQQAWDIAMQATAVAEEKTANEKLEKILAAIEERSELGYMSVNAKFPINKILSGKLESLGFTVSSFIDQHTMCLGETYITWWKFETPKNTAG